MTPNDPQENRPLHPLERRPEPPTPEDTSHGGSRATLHIRTVRPFLTYGLIAINVLIFVVGYFNSGSQVWLLMNGANNREWVFVIGDYSRLLTAMFLHAGLAHLFFNMFSLYYIGGQVEAMFGHVRYGLVYFLGGLAGSLMSAVMSDVYSVGASGAVFAVFGAHMIYLYHHRKLLGEAGRAQLRSLLWIAVMNFAIGIFSAVAPGGVSIDNWGHLGGLLGGVFMAWYIAPFYLLERHPEHPQAFIAVDVNPLKNRYQFLSLYLAGGLTIMLIASMLLRG